VGVLGIQVGIWLTLAHQGPARFIVPAIVPICLLAARALAHLSAVQVNPFRKGASRSPHGAWGVPPAVAIFIAAVTVNLWTTYNLYRDTARAENGRPPETLAIKSILSSTGELPSLSENARFLLIGNMQLFYFPSGTIYAIPFDANPLAEIIESESSPRRMLERLRGLGVTHLWVNWAEVWRLAQTYGYPDVLSGELFERWEKRQRPGLSVLDEFEKLGAVPRDIDPDRPFAAGVYWKPRAKPVPWVAVTVYTLPWAVNPTTSSPSTPPKTTTSS